VNLAILNSGNYPTTIQGIPELSRLLPYPITDASQITRTIDTFLASLVQGNEFIVHKDNYEFCAYGAKAQYLKNTYTHNPPLAADPLFVACTCPEGLTDCNQDCVDLQTDPNNCGDCGNVCPEGFVCVDGVCVCPDGLTDCSGECVDLQTDSNNCGDCGIVCPPGFLCEDGVCVDHTCELLPPAVPQVEISPGITRIGLRWDDVPCATSYNVYRSISSGTETLYQSGVSRTAKIYTDTGVVGSTTYFYKVTAVGLGGESALSAELSGILHTNAVDINGGLSWSGWQYRGLSTDLMFAPPNYRRYCFNAGTDVYEMYSTIFVFDSGTNVITGAPVMAPPPTPAGFAAGAFSTGAFTTGNIVLGLGVHRISGSTIAGASKFTEFEWYPDDGSLRPSTLAAPAGNGRCLGDFDIYSHTGDNTTIFTPTGTAFFPDNLTVQSGQGSNWGGPVADKSLPSGVGSGTSRDFAFRMFRQVAADSYQQFFDLTAMQALYGPTAANSPGLTSFGTKVSPGGPVATTVGIGSDLGGFAVGPLGPIVLYSLNGTGFATFTFSWFVR
jgi:hypothetical protein